MFEVVVKDSFSAAHQIKGYKGKCEKLHGHNWLVEISVASSTLDANEMVVDFVVLKKHLKKTLSKIDHTLINKHPYFKKNAPTAENIAYYVFCEMQRSLKNITAAAVRRVSVSETDKSTAVYTRDE